VYPSPIDPRGEGKAASALANSNSILFIDENKEKTSKDEASPHWRPDLARF
jgi:hypothetical protein